MTSRKIETTEGLFLTGANYCKEIMIIPLAGEAGERQYLDCRPHTKGFSALLCQGLPGCGASSVLSLDIASRTHEGASLNREPQNSPELSAGTHI